MLKKKIFMMLFTVLALNSLATEVENVLVTENPNRATPILTLDKKNRDAELNITVTKATTKKIPAIYSISEEKYIFEIPEGINNGESIFVTDKGINNLLLWKNHIKTISHTITGNKVIVNKNINLDSLYIFKYKKGARDLKNVYSWNREINESIFEKNKIEVKILDDYNLYNEVRIGNSNLLSFNSDVQIKGNLVEIDKNTTSIDIYSASGTKLKSLPLTSGNGKYGMDNSENGLKISSSEGYAKFGIGFENGNILLKLKEWNLKGGNYNMILKIKSPGEEKQQIIKLITPPQKVKVLANSIDLDFGYIAKNAKSVDIIEKIKEVDVQVPTSVNAITTKFADGNKMQMKHNEKEDSFSMKLEIEEKKEKRNLGNKIKTFNITGKVSSQDIKDLASGTYTGKTELIIEIDS